MTIAEAETSNKCQLKFSDQILGVLDFKTKKLYTFVGSSY